MCAGCGQYNGFNKDGDYNREIPEMYSTKLNPVKNCVFSEENVYGLKKSNGLCDACNRDQELKILQLAAFVPEDEENYIEEVDRYRETLEKSYRLCGKCDRVLKRSLNQVKSHIVGSKMSEQILKYQKKSPGKRAQIMKYLAYLVFFISIISILTSINDFHISNEKLTAIFGTELSQMILKTLSYWRAVKSVAKDYIQQGIDNPIMQGAWIYISSTIKLCTDWLQRSIEFNFETGHDLKEFYNILAMLGTVMLMVLFEGERLIGLLISLFIWSSKTLLHNHEILLEPIDTDNLHIFDMFLAVAAFFTTYQCLGYAKETIRHSSNLNSSFHKLHPDVTEDSEDEMDNSSYKYNESLLNSTFKAPVFEAQKANSSSFFVGSALNNSFNYSRPPSVLSSSFKSPSELNCSRLTSKEMLDVNVGQLTKLNLDATYNTSIKSFATTVVSNPFYNHLNLDRQTPLSVVSLRTRSIISPPKLNADTVCDPSWVAGGFWTTSPKKTAPPNTDFMPIMSRTSSQSSGFESQGGGQNSRENSLTKDIDKPSILSEPSLMQFNTMRPVKPFPVYPTGFVTGVTNSFPSFDGSFLKPTPMQNSSMNLFTTSPSRASITSRMSNRSIFGEQEFNDTSSLHSYRTNNGRVVNTQHHSNHSNYSGTHRLGNRSIFNFKKFSNDLPLL